MILACHLKLSGTKYKCQTTILMKSFIEDYPQNPGQAIADAVLASKSLGWSDNIDEDLIYAQIASGEFRLYEDIVVS